MARRPPNEQERKLLDDIAGRTETLLSKFGKIEAPIKALAVVLHNNEAELRAIFIRVVSSLNNPAFFKPEAFNKDIITLGDKLGRVHNAMEKLAPLIRRDVRATKKVRNTLTKIEREEIVLTSSESAVVREAIKVELKRVGEAEELFDNSINSLMELRTFIGQFQNAKPKLTANSATYNKAKEAALTPLKIVQEALDDMIRILNVDAALLTNLQHIGNLVNMLQANIKGLRAGAEAVTVR